MKAASRTLALFVFLALALPPSLLAQSGARSHDGFFLRFLVGAGPGAVVMDDLGGEELTLSLPSATDFHVQIGGAVAPNLVMFADLGGFSLIDPDMEWGAITGSSQDTEVVVSGIGAGVSYYWMPANIYLSASALLSVASLTFQGSEGESEFGGSTLVSVGKEWWVGDRWGLGVALFLDAGTMLDQADDFGNQATLTTFAGGIAFSATLN